MKLRIAWITAAVSIAALIGGVVCARRLEKPIEIRLLAGSENRSLEPLLRRFEEERRVRVIVSYSGSADILRALRLEKPGFDAIWPADAVWIRLGDAQRRVKDIQSIYISPVIFGIRRSLADSLGFSHGGVSSAAVFDAVKSGRLRLGITSPDHSNSGLCALLMMLRATSGIPDERTLWSLDSAEGIGMTKELIGRVHRGILSSGWLEERFLIGGLDGMVNYESMIIQANLDLIRLGREPLRVVYPSDGVIVCDAPMGWVETGDRLRESTARALQEYLLSEEARRLMVQFGRRPTRAEGMSSGLSAFHADWGLEFGPIQNEAKWPSDETVLGIIDWYRGILANDPFFRPDSCQVSAGNSP
jgi:Ca-activated chloride channel homolog